ncbi:hypothetical protein ABE65_001520 [Fictibacillus phosphorivorans]|uniref:Uncharacterized protein n=1 Tax=Fictibacillus phosphorivorans TaxID=1221500 RepID=A0A160II96_9BACL|nr:hypothetical protein [Fictibacillus phosphorivorans]ANC75594.1 hypothetical protein ABE65_001520 [Fictibacillus phosphorivorans]
MTVLLLAGIVLTLILLMKQRDFASVGMVRNISYRLKGRSLSTNYWQAGIALFAANAALFALAFVILFFLPYGAMVGLLLCIPLSLFTWVIFSEVWEGAMKDKVKMASIGSSFFLLFLGYIFWYYATLEPAYPGDDLFMAWIGVIIATIFAIGAMCVSMFVILRK